MCPTSSAPVAPHPQPQIRDRRAAPAHSFCPLFVLLVGIILLIDRVEREAQRGRRVGQPMIKRGCGAEGGQTMRGVASRAPRGGGGLRGGGFGRGSRRCGGEHPVIRKLGGCGRTAVREPRGTCRSSRTTKAPRFNCRTHNRITRYEYFVIGNAASDALPIQLTFDGMPLCLAQLSQPERVRVLALPQPRRW